MSDPVPYNPIPYNRFRLSDKFTVDVFDDGSIHVFDDYPVEEQVSLNAEETARLLKALRASSEKQLPGDQTGQVVAEAQAAGFDVEQLTQPLGIDPEADAFVVKSVRVLSTEALLNSLTPGCKLWIYQAYLAPGDELLTIRYYVRGRA